MISTTLWILLGVLYIIAGVLVHRWVDGPIITELIHSEDWIDLSKNLGRSLGIIILWWVVLVIFFFFIVSMVFLQLLKVAK